MKDCKSKTGKKIMPKTSFKTKMEVMKSKITGKPMGSKKMKDKK